jgi:hypothetical protein
VVSAASLKRGFAVLLLAVGAFVLAKNHRVITDAAASTSAHGALQWWARPAAGGPG